MEAINFIDLPNEMLLEIISYLTPQDQRIVRLVSKSFLGLIDGAKKMLENCTLVINDYNISEIKERIESKNVANLNFNDLSLLNLKNSTDVQFIFEAIGKDVHHLTMQKSETFASLKGKLKNLQSLNLYFDDALQSSECHLNLSEFPALNHLELINNHNMLDLSKKLLCQLAKEPFINRRLKHLKLVTMKKLEIQLYDVMKYNAETLEFLDMTVFDDLVLENGLWRDIFVRCKKLKSVRFSGCWYAKWLEIFFNSVPTETQLEHVSLNHCYLNESMLKLISNKWTNSLEVIELINCLHIADEGVIEFAILPKLLKINLCKSYKLSSLGLLNGIAAKINPIIQEMDLTWLQGLNESGLILLISRLPNLRDLKLNFLRNIATNNAVSHLFHLQTKLRRLSMHGLNITDDGLIGFGNNPYAMKRLRGLEFLSLHFCTKLTDRTLIEALHFPELRILDLSACHKITTRGIEELVKNCPSLEVFRIPACLMLDENALIVIGNNLKRLYRLEISICRLISLETFELLKIQLDALRPTTSRHFIIECTPFCIDCLLRF